MSYRVAIVGASGAVGQELLTVLARRRFPLAQLRLFGSERSAGTRMVFLGEQLPVELLREGVFGDTDVALFSAGSGTSKIFAPKAVAQGAMVVDNSSAFRQLAHVPLVVPEINGERIADHQGIIANPNCTTIVTLMAVAPLHRTAVVRSMIVDSYQAASGAGAQALAELDAQSAAMASGSEVRAARQAWRPRQPWKADTPSK